MTVPIYLNACAVVCALGRGKPAVKRAMLDPDGPGGVREHTHRGWVGLVETPVDPLSTLPPPLRSRCHGLLALTLDELRPSWEALGNRERAAVVLGTSTSGILHGELAMQHRRLHGIWPEGYHYSQQEMGTPAYFVAQSLGIWGPAYTVSTACSSSAKALISAARMLRTDLADVVIAGGADALSDITVQGFRALASVVPSRTNPFSRQRCGINIGEAAALFVVSRQPGPVQLLGWGETTDAHHISAPEPNGRAAAAAMMQALHRGGVDPEQVDYVNLHGTGTVQNDAMESRAMHSTLGPQVCASSTKPLTGHTLGAAGALEAAVSWLTLVDNPGGALPPHWWDGEVDPDLPAVRLVRPGETLGRPPRTVLSQSFAFGGSNVVLLLRSTA